MLISSPIFYCLCSLSAAQGFGYLHNKSFSQRSALYFHIDFPACKQCPAGHGYSSALCLSCETRRVFHLFCCRNLLHRPLLPPYFVKNGMLHLPRSIPFFFSDSPDDKSPIQPHDQAAERLLLSYCRNPYTYPPVLQASLHPARQCQAP